MLFPELDEVLSTEALWHEFAIAPQAIRHHRAVLSESAAFGAVAQCYFFVASSTPSSSALHASAANTSTTGPSCSWPPSSPDALSSEQIASWSRLAATSASAASQSCNVRASAARAAPLAGAWPLATQDSAETMRESRTSLAWRPASAVKTDTLLASCISRLVAFLNSGSSATVAASPSRLTMPAQTLPQDQPHVEAARVPMACPTCSDWAAERGRLFASLETVKMHMNDGNERLRHHMDRSNELQQENTRLKEVNQRLMDEVEQLSQIVFEEANRMVADERRSVDRLRTENEILRQLLGEQQQQQQQPLANSDPPTA
ncbi:hypothetical protein BC831DRAFT_480374 [Entophlyctis helioformis]|nr:hypothetical protein BC831DRAFT_480374 [Entophlyctis helioformis]